MPRRLKSLRVRTAFFLSWALFGGAAAGLSAVCAPLLACPGRERFGEPVRALIRRLFRIWVAWLEGSGLVRVRWEGTEPDRLPGPAVYVANHPSLLDATFLLARIPDAITILKPALLRNPVLGPAARLAGYAAANEGVDLVRRLASELARGRNVLVFPEGTRTGSRSRCEALRPGFILIARRAGVPVRLLRIWASRDLLPRGGFWWQAPEAPSPYSVRAAGTLDVDPDRPVADILRELRRRLAGRECPDPGPALTASRP